MRIRVMIVALSIVIGGCGAGSTPAPSDSQEPQTQYGQVVEHANDVADQANQREADLEHMVAEMGG